MRCSGLFPAQFLAGGALLCLLLLVPGLSAGASLYERLYPGRCFVVRHEQGDLRYDARLRLLSRHFFELAESFAYKKQPPLRRVFTGLWFQLRGGSLLWLYNRYGLSRACNVGAAGALYADMPLPGGRGSLSVVFSPAAGEGGPLRLMGTLRPSPGGPVLAESASGLVFAIDSPLPGELKDRPLPLFLELDARLAGGRLAVERIRSASSRLPSGLDDAPRPLSAVAAGLPWLLELPDGQEYSASFVFEALPPPGGDAAQASPRLDLAGQGLYLSLSLTVSGYELRIAPTEADCAMLHALGLDSLLDALLSLRRWQLHGPLLVLYDEDAPRCMLSRRDGRF